QVSYIPPQLGVFFDGTGNNRHNDLKYWDDAHEPTNIAKLYELYPAKSTRMFESVYIDGIGTAPDKKDDDIDMAFARSFGTRLESAIDSAQKFFSDHPRAPVGVLDVFGFSRGAAAARAFINEVHKINNTEPRFWGGPRLVVRFLGLFDTVGSIGLPGDNDNGPFILDIHPDAVAYAYHITARDERREYFPCSSLQVEAYRMPAAHFAEEALLGAHSDIGGGYGPVPQIVFYPPESCTWNASDERDRHVARISGKLKAEYSKKYHWPGIDIQFKTRNEDGADSLNKTTIYPYWERDVKTQLAHCALHKMHAVAMQRGVPLEPLDTLLGTAAFRGHHPERVYAIPEELEELLDQMYANMHEVDAENHVLQHYVHHSHQYAADPDAVVNANKPESGPKIAAPNQVRELFYNNIDNAHAPDDVWRLVQSPDETQYTWVRQKRAE
ncbi:MAG: DUF2235 domain-containing protein, partial [Pseudomonadota bacterium]